MSDTLRTLAQLRYSRWMNGGLPWAERWSDAEYAAHRSRERELEAELGFAPASEAPADPETYYMGMILRGGV